MVFLSERTITIIKTIHDVAVIAVVLFSTTAVVHVKLFRTRL